MGTYRMYECDVCKKQVAKDESVLQWYSAVLRQGDQVRSDRQAKTLLSIDACSEECVIKAVREALK